ncbi:alpha/beta hydrolase [Candidatus Sumerlaeota bacterium]|nr:alpha/beta hydrolase [Candidatus Sumerlaeota bacterium]
MRRARPLLSDTFHLIEVAYPHIPHWNLPDFAAALEDLLNRLGIAHAHLAAESFGSLVGWEFVLTRPERVQSLTLVGGFSRPPVKPGVHLARWGLAATPTSVFETGINLYCALRHGKRGVQEGDIAQRPYPAARTRGGRLATVNRLRLIGESDYRERLPAIGVPVRYVGGARDLVVPVRREIRTLEAALPSVSEFEAKLIPGAPHMIIATHPEQTAEQIAQWVRESEADKRAKGEIRGENNAEQKDRHERIVSGG